MEQDRVAAAGLADALGQSLGLVTIAGQIGSPCSLADGGDHGNALRIVIASIDAASTWMR